MPRKSMTYKKRPRGSNLAKKVYQLSKKVNAILDVADNATTLQFNTTGSTAIVTYIPPAGTGDKTTLKYLHLRGVIRQNPSSTMAEALRVDVMLDRQPAGVILDASKAYNASVLDIGEMPRASVKDRYKLLRSKLILFDEAENGRSIAGINMKIPLNLIATTSSSSSFTQANIQRNAVYVVMWGTSTANYPISDMTATMYSLDDS